MDEGRSGPGRRGKRAAPWADAAGLAELTVMLRAYRRVEVLVGHLRLSPALDTVALVATGRALVPLPGTLQHEDWMRTLASARPGSVGEAVLREWSRMFWQSGPAIKAALRRFLVLSAHLSHVSSARALSPNVD